MADYRSQFTGEEIDARLAKVPQLESGKQDTLVSGINIKTVNGQSVLGPGDIEVPAGETDAVKYVSQALTDAQKEQARANIGSGTYSKPASGIPASDLASGVIPDISGKQDVIADLSTIRSGSAAGATAVQPADLDEYKDQVDSEIAAFGNQSYVEAWNGTEVPTVANIPAGVTVEYGGTSYTGTLVASADTLNKIYLVKNGVNYDKYITSKSGDVYSWAPNGSTAIELSDYATNAEVTQLQEKVIELDITNDITAGAFQFSNIVETGGLVTGAAIVWSDGATGAMAVTYADGLPTQIDYTHILDGVTRTFRQTVAYAGTNVSSNTVTEIV